MIGTVFIYQDYIHNNGLLHRNLCACFGGEHVRFCDAGDIIRGCLDEDVSLFVMPGGADLYYTEKLDGAGNQAIRSYVEKGGCYLGICAGAYYACAEIEWAKNEGASAICAPRELGFFPGKAVGPVCEFIEENDFSKSWYGAARLFYDEGNTQINTLVPYEAGPVFEGCDDENCQIFARYTDLPNQPAAIIECSVGEGKAILCSPHMEKFPRYLQNAIYDHGNNSFDWEKNIVKELEAYENEIEKLWFLLLQQCS